MKETKLLKEVIVEETTFECEECGFKTTDFYEAQKHELKFHCIKNEVSLEEDTLYWFDSEEKARYWHEHGSFRYGLIDLNIPYYIPIVRWSGPGWYCLDEFKNLCHVDDIILERMGLIKKLNKSLEAIKKVIWE